MLSGGVRGLQLLAPSLTLDACGAEEVLGPCALLGWMWGVRVWYQGDEGSRGLVLCGASADRGDSPQLGGATRAAQHFLVSKRICLSFKCKIKTTLFF